MEPEYTIWKYHLTVDGTQSLTMPEGARILSLQVQVNTPTIWVLVNKRAPLIRRKFAMFGTGHVVDAETQQTGSYIGTFQIANGALVFHLFEISL